jgi:hypothetical protein
MVPSTLDSSAVPAIPAAKSFAKSFIKHIHYQQLVGLVWKTSMAAFRSKFGIDLRFKSTL